MGEFVLDRLHPLLQQLVLYQRAKREVKEVLAGIKEIVEAEWSSDTLPKQERAACEAAILIALRVGAESSLVTGCWRRDRTGYAAIVHACRDQRRSGDSMQHSSIKFHHVHPLLSALLSDVEGDSSAIFTVLQAAHDMCEAILRNDGLRKEFLSPRHVPLYGKLVSVCLEIVSNNSKDSRCRHMTLKTLEAVVESSKEDSLSLCVVLPGLSSSLAAPICESANEHLDIITTSLKIISMAVRYCLADSVKDDESIRESEGIRPEIRELLVRRDGNWKATSAGNITKMIRTLCSTLAVHHDEEVRSTLLMVVDSIRSDCKSAFNGTLDAFLMDLLLTVQATTSSDSEIAARLRTENITAFSLHMLEKLRELAERIPLNVRKGTTGSNMLFHQLAGVLSCLNADVSRLATSRAPSLEAMFSALAASLRVDARRLLISRGQIRESSV
ncbi:hypothetical protein ANCCAN_29159, partial [Ancylostoma caninum]